MDNANLQNERKAKAIIGKLLPVFTAEAKRLGLQVKLSDPTYNDQSIRFEDVDPDDFCRYEVVLQMKRTSWGYHPTGDVVIKTIEPKPGRKWSRRTVCRGAYKGGKLNIAPVMEWIGQVAEAKRRIAENKVRQAEEADKEVRLRREALALQKAEIGEDIPPGMTVSREMEGDQKGLYTVTLSEEVGPLKAEQVKAIIAILRPTNNS